MSYEMDRLIYGDEREAKGRLLQLVDLVRDGTLDVKTASEKANMTEEAFEALLEN